MGVFRVVDSEANLSTASYCRDLEHRIEGGSARGGAAISKGFSGQG